MKLPEGVKQEKNIRGPYFNLDEVEAIVRDCAAYCLIGCTDNRYVDTESRKQIGDMILARYGLESK